VICERCGTVFCWDDADIGALAGKRKRFCSARCKKKASSVLRNRAELAAAYELAAPRLAAEAENRRKREEAARPACPTPEKLAFADQGDALAKAPRIVHTFGRAHKAYECVCGKWHLTAKWAKVPAVRPS
jgi:hypothetical protein